MAAIGARCGWAADRPDTNFVGRPSPLGANADTTSLASISVLIAALWSLLECCGRSPQEAKADLRGSHFRNACRRARVSASMKAALRLVAVAVRRSLSDQPKCWLATPYSWPIEVAK